MHNLCRFGVVQIHKYVFALCAVADERMNSNLIARTAKLIELVSLLLCFQGGSSAPRNTYPGAPPHIKGNQRPGGPANMTSPAGAISSAPYRGGAGWTQGYAPAQQTYRYTAPLAAQPAYTYTQHTATVSPKTITQHALVDIVRSSLINRRLPSLCQLPD